MFFYVFFLFLEETDIKENKNTYLVQFLTEVGYGSLIELTSVVKFQTMGKQLKFRPNYKWVSCNLP